MSLFPDITSLRTSWTKYDIVQVIEMTLNGEIDKYLKKEIGIDEPILRSYLGINSLNDELPYYWRKIYDFPDQIGLFALTAAIFTHFENIHLFANEFNKGDMHGVLRMQEGKHYTNLRSALVVSGASEKIYRRKSEVPYDFSKLFEVGDVGLLVKDLLIERLGRVGYPNVEAKERFIEITTELGFFNVFGLTREQFEEWTKGIGVSNSLYELQKNNISQQRFGKIKALKVKQWLSNWDNVPNFGAKNRRKPEPFFYQFNIPAILLKRIYDVHSRLAYSGRKDELYSQRKHSEKRSKEIREFVQGGFPWSTISDDQRQTAAYKNLQMPGWLPTSIIANILSDDSVRRQKKIDDDALIKIHHLDDNFAELHLPEKIWTDKWTPIVSPIEIIDGQHRIKAFDNIREIGGDYELPVIAFFDLDFTWQAYLFYTINIKPKRINTSLAYDLMPLLRIQDWLEQDLDGPDIYKKVRAQELTELLWKTEISPWFERINMLGDTGEKRGGPVSQNAFINSLTASFVRKWEGKIGGLFGGEIHEGEQDVIQWDKEIQAAYLVLIWQSLVHAIKLSKAEWVIDLLDKKDRYEIKESERNLPIPFIHDFSFFTTDQGVRPILFIFNDMSFLAADALGLNRFIVEVDYEKYTTSEIIEIIFERFKENKIINAYITGIATELVNNFDWRTPSAFDSNIQEEDLKRQHQNQFKGSSGYREMRIQLLRILSKSSIEIEGLNGKLSLSAVAQEIQTKLGL